MLKFDPTVQEWTFELPGATLKGVGAGDRVFSGKKQSYEYWSDGQSTAQIDALNAKIVKLEGNLAALDDTMKKLLKQDSKSSQIGEEKGPTVGEVVGISIGMTVIGMILIIAFICYTRRNTAVTNQDSHQSNKDSHQDNQA